MVDVEAGEELAHVVRVAETEALPQLLDQHQRLVALQRGDRIPARRRRLRALRRDHLDLVAAGAARAAARAGVVDVEAAEEPLDELAVGDRAVGVDVELAHQLGDGRVVGGHAELQQRLRELGGRDVARLVRIEVAEDRRCVLALLEPRPQRVEEALHLEALLLRRALLLAQRVRRRRRRRLDVLLRRGGGLRARLHLAGVDDAAPLLRAARRVDDLRAHEPLLDVVVALHALRKLGVVDVAVAVGVHRLGHPLELFVRLAREAQAAHRVGELVVAQLARAVGVHLAEDGRDDPLRRHPLAQVLHDPLDHLLLRLGRGRRRARRRPRRLPVGRPRRPGPQPRRRRGELRRVRRLQPRRRRLRPRADDAQVAAARAHRRRLRVRGDAHERPRRRRRGCGRKVEPVGRAHHVAPRRLRAAVHARPAGRHDRGAAAGHRAGERGEWRKSTTENRTARIRCNCEGAPQRQVRLRRIFRNRQKLCVAHRRPLSPPCSPKASSSACRPTCSTASRSR